MTIKRDFRSRFLLFIMALVTLILPSCEFQQDYEYTPDAEFFNRSDDPMEDAVAGSGVAAADVPPAKEESAEDEIDLGNALRSYALPHEDGISLLASVRILRLTSTSEAHSQFRKWCDLAAQFERQPYGGIDDLAKWTLDFPVKTTEHPFTTDYDLHDARKTGVLEYEITLADHVWRFGIHHEDPLVKLAAVHMLARLPHNNLVPEPAELKARLKECQSELTKEQDCFVGLLTGIEQRISSAPTIRSGTDWFRFLGPRGNGHSIETDDSSANAWVTTARNGPKVLWQKEIGTGYSACALKDKRLYVFDQIGNLRRLSCLDPTTGEDFRDADTGEKLWDDAFTYAVPHGAPGGYKGPRASPILDENRIYIYDEKGMLHCLNADDRKVIWKVDTVRDFGVVQNHFGVASTPVVSGDLLITMVGGSHPDFQDITSDKLDQVKGNGSAIVAFRKDTGVVEYQAGHYLASYSSPVVADINGQSWGFAFLREGLFAFHPETGSEFSQFPFFPWHSTHREAINACTPLVVNDQVFVSAAYGKGSALLSVGSNSTSVVWQNEPDATDSFGMEALFMTPVPVDGYLYGSSGTKSGESGLRCVEWDTGNIMWPIEEEDRKKAQIGRASLIYLDGYLICLAEDGRLYLVSANPEKLEISEIPLRDAADSEMPEGFKPKPLLHYPCWTAPVLSHGLLYLRDSDRLICVELIPRHSN